MLNQVVMFSPMNEQPVFKTVLTKVLAIVGFFVTLALLVWLAIEGGKRAPGAFASLASLVDGMNRSGVHELTLATEKSVVNSEESFQISWTDMRTPGEYVFSYTCTEGVDLHVREENDELRQIPCTSTLTLPGSVHGLFLTLTSDEMRFIDVPLSVSFKNQKTGVTMTSDTKVTVVNAMIPVGGVVTVPTPVAPSGPTPAPAREAVAQTNAPIPKPVYSIIVPKSDPNGFVDLKTTFVSIGTITNGVYTPAPTYDRTKENAIRFDVKNVGTKTSGAWTFRTILPTGEIYESDGQEGLKPQERIEFTLGFHLPEKTGGIVEITTTAYTKGDTNPSNDSSWRMIMVGT